MGEAVARESETLSFGSGLDSQADYLQASYSVWAVIFSILKQSQWYQPHKATLIIKWELQMHTDIKLYSWRLE